MKRNKLVVLAMALVMTLSMILSGCAQKENGATPEPAATEKTSTTEAEPAVAEKEKFIIGCTFDYVSDFMAYVADGASGYQKDHPEVEIVILDAGKDVAKQLKDVENLIAQNVDAIVIKPVDVDACKPIIDACKEAGIPLINANSPLNGEVTSFVGSDSLVAGRLQAEYIVEQLGGKGVVNILLGDPNNQDSRDRTAGNKEIFAKYPGITVGAEQVGKWMRDTGMQVTENWIQSKEPMDAIIANNDEMAMGAALAVKEAGIKVLIAGVDATPDALQMLKDGVLSVTVFQNGYQQGYVGVETAIKAAKGEPVEARIDIPYELVTVDKADEYLAKYK